MESPGIPLAQRLECEIPACHPRLDPLANGAYLIDLTIKGEAFVVEYYPRVGLGISRLRPSGYGWESLDSEFENEDALVRHIAGLSGPG